MKTPLSMETTFAYFGLLLGTFPPASLFLRFAIDANIFRTEDAWIVVFLFFSNLLSAVTGYFSGKLVGKVVREIEKSRWTVMLTILPFVGLVWGMLAGIAGGFIILIVGAFFGAILGGVVGTIALPAFAVFHRALKRGDVIERSHFLPVAFGITFTICSFILGL